MVTILRFSRTTIARVYYEYMDSGKLLVVRENCG